MKKIGILLGAVILLSLAVGIREGAAEDKWTALVEESGRVLAEV